MLLRIKSGMVACSPTQQREPRPRKEDPQSAVTGAELMLALYGSLLSLIIFKYR